MGFSETLEVTPTLRRSGYTLVSAVGEVAAGERLQVSIPFHLCPHWQGNSHAQGHSSLSHIIEQPRRTGNNEYRTSHRAAYPHNNFSFIYCLSVGRCLFNY